MMIAGRRLPPRAAPPLGGDDGRGDGAGGPGLGDAYRWCRRTVRERDPAIYALTALMPRMLWPGCWALWAALAAVDDIADSGPGHPAERAAGVQAWVSALDAELAAGTSTNMVRRALADTIVRWGLDVADLRASFGVLAGDVYPAPCSPGTTGGRGRGGWTAGGRQILVLLDRAGVDMSVALRPARRSPGSWTASSWSTIWPTCPGISASGRSRSRPSPGPLSRRRRGHAPAAVAAPVQDVLAHLVSMARRWVDQPGLGTGWHRPAILLATTSRVFLARLDAIAAAGPGLLHASPEPGRITRWRLLARVKISPWPGS